MVEYNKINVKLPVSQLNKLKSAVKNYAEWMNLKECNIKNEYENVWIKQFTSRNIIDKTRN